MLWIASIPGPGIRSGLGLFDLVVTEWSLPACFSCTVHSRLFLDRVGTNFRIVPHGDPRGSPSKPVFLVVQNGLYRSRLIHTLGLSVRPKSTQCLGWLNDVATLRAGGKLPLQNYCRDLPLGRTVIPRVENTDMSWPQFPMLSGMFHIPRALAFCCHLSKTFKLWIQWLSKVESHE